MRLAIHSFVALMACSAFARVPIWYRPGAGPLISVRTATPAFENREFFLDDAPTGIGARAMWSHPGGSGAEVKVIDIEVCFDTHQEDNPPFFYVGANPAAKCESTDHGTAVVGVVGGHRDSKGITGIAYGAKLGVYGFLDGDEDTMSPAYIQSVRTAIRESAAQLAAGDVLIIEQEMNGPDGDTAIEYWPEIFDELKAVTARGIHCVEASGNGGSNLDSTKYGGAFDLNKRDSGCLMVGAANPDRTRAYFSNYGTRVDVYGFGDGVTTTAYGDLFNGGKSRLYTGSFNGTSSATPIVAGAVAILSSIAKVQGRILSPSEVREALRVTGTAVTQTNPGDPPGNLPDLQALMHYFRLK